MWSTPPTLSTHAQNLVWMMVYRGSILQMTTKSPGWIRRRNKHSRNENTKFEVRIGLPIRKIWHTFDLSINRPGDLDLWHWNLETGAHYWSWDGQPFYQFWYFWDLLSSTYGPTSGSRIIITPIKIGGHVACQWYGCSCSVGVQSFMFVGLPVRKILRIYRMSINRPGK